MPRIVSGGKRFMGMRGTKGSSYGPTVLWPKLFSESSTIVADLKSEIRARPSCGARQACVTTCADLEWRFLACLYAPRFHADTKPFVFNSFSYARFFPGVRPSGKMQSIHGELGALPEGLHSRLGLGRRWETSGNAHNSSPPGSTSSRCGNGGSNGVATVESWKMASKTGSTSMAAATSSPPNGAAGALAPPAPTASAAMEPPGAGARAPARPNLAN